FLCGQGLRVTAAADGREMEEKLKAARIDVIVLDIMLPGEDGLSIMRKLRSTSSIPVILLTAVAAETDRIIGLELGAEDYVCKPFSLRERLARIRVVLRRGLAPEEGGERKVITLFRFEGWEFDARARLLTSPRGGHVELTTGEFELLQAFVEHPNQVLSRDQ